MKKITLIRHAKSSWVELGCPDHQRKLSPRGMNDLITMGELLKNRNVSFDRVFCSDAVRTRLTWEGLQAQGFGTQTPVFFTSELYHASDNQLLSYMRRLPDADSHVALIGHNPGFENLVNFFGLSVKKFPTLAIATFQASTSKWADFGRQPLRLDWFTYPKKVRGPGTDPF
ncbi:MAG: SixA phosphatase family protein [Nitritalea sp.]